MTIPAPRCSSSLNQIPKRSRNRTFLGAESSSAGYHLLALLRGISLVPEPNVTDLFDIVVVSVGLVFVVGSYRGSCQYCCDSSQYGFSVEVGLCVC